MPRRRREPPPEPFTLLEVVVIGSCLIMWAYFIFVALGWSPLL